MVVRMRDVARHAGVSQATVSLALSGSPRISEPTRVRVVELAGRLGYRPHAGARSLRTERTNALGLVISDVANPFFAELAGEIQRSAAAAGYSLVLWNSDEDPARQDACLSSLLAGSQVDGVMLVPVAAMTPGILAAGAAGARLVLVDRPVAVTGRGSAVAHLAACPVVRSSAAAALADSAELLTRLGHRRVGIIAPPLETQVGRERRDLLRGALMARGVNRGDVAVVAGDFRQDSGQRAVGELLARRHPPTAVFAADGPMAIGAMKGLRRAGLRIPYDISVIGFDDAPWFELFDPPLTTVAQPVAQLAAAAVRAMLALLSGQPPLSASLPCRLVRRSSCGVAPAGAGTGPPHAATRARATRRTSPERTAS